MLRTDSVAIFSGGLDSTTLVYHMLSKGYTPHLLSFNYGQRHSKELEYAAITAKQLELQHDIIDLTGLTHLISNSALTCTSPLALPDEVYTPRIEVPEGHYAEENMKATVVPNRNMIMLSIAAGVAVNNGYKTIGIGTHSGDHPIYSDCRPEFIYATAKAIVEGNEGHKFDLEHSSFWCIYAPFMSISKTDIVFEAIARGVPLHHTWSCYKGGEVHCGRCGTCVERLEAINKAIAWWRDNYRYGTLNPCDTTKYADTEYWKTQVGGR